MEKNPLSMGETFRKFCPYYLHLGMTWDQYWHGDPWMVVYYYEAHKLEIEQRNQELWMQGAYIYDAFTVVLSNAFAAKGSTPKRYMEKPIDILPKTEEEKAAEEERELRRMVQQLNAWEKSFNAGKPEDGSS